MRATNPRIAYSAFGGGAAGALWRGLGPCGGVRVRCEEGARVGRYGGRYVNMGNRKQAGPPITVSLCQHISPFLTVISFLASRLQRSDSCS